MRLVDDNALGRIDSHLRASTARLFGGRGLSAFGGTLAEYAIGGGKRVRPQLCVWTYCRCDQSLQLTDSVLDLACAWELFHAFLLAHDDIIDKGDTRRSQPSLHRQLAALDSGSEVFGVNLAIVGGDLLFTAAIELLHGLEFPDRQYREILRLFSRVASTTGFGQAVDIVQGHVALDAVREEELLREYLWKTAAYTFEGPMVSGAIAGGATKDAQDAIARFALALGQAYQMQNDLIDLNTPSHGGSDLAQGKRTITLMRARAAMGEGERAGFDGRVELAAGGNLAVAEGLRAELRERGATDETDGIVRKLLKEAADAAGDRALCCEMRKGLGELLGGLRAGYFEVRR